MLVFWLALAVVPLGGLLAEGYNKRRAALAGLYLVGWFFAVIAWRRERSEQTVNGFWQTATASVALLILTVCLFGAFQISVFYGQAVLMLATVGFWALAATSGSGATLVRRTGVVLLLAGSLGLLAAAGEVTLRVRALIAPAPATHYDSVAEQNPLHLRSLRGTRVDQSKPPGMFRVLTVGDSFTWGHGIAKTEAIWPYVLEDLLRRARDTQAEVVNLARRGYSTVNEAEALKNLGWKFEPDVVILQTLLNDVLPSQPGGRHEEAHWYFRLVSLLPADSELEKCSRLYLWLNGAFRNAQMALFYPSGFVPLYDDSFAGWRDCRQALREMAQESRRRNVRFLTVLFPDFVPEVLDEHSYRYLSAHQAMLQAAQSAGAETLDLLPVYASHQKPGRAWWASPTDAHPNESAHAIAAGAIGQKLLELGWVPQPVASSK